jgi:photosystem II stability/assembly factor-like uncharacterized protein
MTTDAGATFNVHSYTMIDDVEPGDSYLQRIAFADTSTGIIINAGGGVFRTIDGGKSWNGIFPKSYFFSNCAFIDSKYGWLFGSSGARRSVDAGKTWDSIWNPILYQSGIFTRIFALDNQRVWLLKSFHYNAGGNIFYSADGGVTWAPQNTGIISDSSNQIRYYDLKINPSGLGVAIANLYRPSSRYSASLILRTEDFGNTWTSIEFDKVTYRHLISISDGLWIIYGNDENHAVQLRSTDFGQSWLKTSNLFSSTHYSHLSTVVYLSNTDVILLNNICSYYRSTDRGLTYQKLSHGTDISINDFDIDQKDQSDSQLVVATSDNGKYMLSVDGGKHWNINSLPDDVGTSIGDVSVVDKTIFFIVDYNHIFKSEDLGMSWDVILSHYGGGLHPIVAYDKENIMVTGRRSGSYLIIYSFDGGESWTYAPYDSRASFNQINITNPGEIFACGEFYDNTSYRGMIYHTSDAGLNWRIVDFNPTRELKDLFMINTRKGFALSNYELYRTTDSGGHWDLFMKPNNPYEPFSNICFADSLQGLLRVKNYFLITRNGGDRWDKINLNLPLSGPLYKIVYNKNGDIFALGNSGGFLIYTNEQQSSTNSDTTIRPQNNGDFNLFQNYPNPFNTTTHFRYALVKPVNVTLQVFNSLGQVVTTLVDELQSPGYYDYDWQAEAFASGVYFTRFQAGRFVKTRKLMLLK